MTDAKQLVNNLNQAIKHGDNGIAYLHVDTAIEIKGILEMWGNDRKFITHIHEHLKPGQEVICKICGLTAREICGQTEHQPHPDDELVEKITAILMRHKIFISLGIETELRKLLSAKSPPVEKELNNIIKILYTSEKLQLTHSEVLKLANRLEAIERLLSARSVTREEIEIFIENVPTFDEFPNYLINWLRSKGILIKEEKCGT